MSKEQGTSEGTRVPAAPGLKLSAAQRKADRARREAEEQARQEEQSRQNAKEQVGVRIDPAVRFRARAAFRYAAFHDHVPSFAAFVENALEQEIRRYEEKYNNGEPFEPDTEPLATGPRG